MSAPLFLPGRTCWAVPESTYAGAFIDARDYFRAFAQAALHAEKQIFLSGWQFDSAVELLRGDDAAGFPLPTTLLAFLNALCDRNPKLEIYILAWDFSVVFGMDRQWQQERKFDFKGSQRLHFVYDSKHPVGASQHQKLAIIDGHWAFTGGMDLCDDRWDVEGHADGGLRRNAKGKPYHPKHDVQAVLEGPPARLLADWFVRQWRIATPRPIAPVAVIPKSGRPFDATLDVGAGPVALSQTRGRTFLPPRRAVKEIQDLLVAAVEKAERTLYIENQYFTARAVADALARRMRDGRRGKLEVSIVIPRDRAALEFYTIAGGETRILAELKRLADAHGHRFGVFHPLAPGPDGPQPVWVHSKLMIVDEGFLTIGSANLANRSMGFDTEVNASWSAAPDSPMAGAVRALRERLVAEHAGAAAPVSDKGAFEALTAAAASGVRVQAYRPPNLSPVIANFHSERTIFDPDGQTFDTRIEGFMADSPNSPVTRALRSLIEWMSGRPRRARLRQEEAARVAAEKEN